MVTMRWVRIAVAAVLACGVFGCGGSGGGSSESSNPEGTFIMQMDPVDGTTLNSFDAEFNVNAGVIVGNYARVVYTGGFWDETVNVDGIASTGFIEGTADFVDYWIEFQADYAGGEWSGTYEVWESGPTLLESGNLIIDRTGSGTPDIAATWGGTFTFPIDGTLVEDWDVVLSQKGNFLGGSGLVEGVIVNVTGSIVGRSVVWEAQEIADGLDFWRCRGAVDSEADDMSGTVVKSGVLSGTMAGSIAP